MAWRSERFEMRLGPDEALVLDELRERLQLRTRAQVVRRALALLHEGALPAPGAMSPGRQAWAVTSAAEAWEAEEQRPVASVLKPSAVCRHGVPDCRICQTGRWAR